MKIAIVGTGGVGGYFGARLQQAGHELLFTARGAHLEALRTKGLTLHSVDGDALLPKVDTTADGVGCEPADLVIVAVKTWQLNDVIPIVERLSTDSTRIMSLLNGIGSQDVLAESLGAERVLGGYCNIVSSIEAPGVVRHHGVVPTINFGVLGKGHDMQRAGAIRDALDIKGITVGLDDEVRVGLWRKYVFVSTWGGVGAVSRAPMDVMRSIPETRALLVALIHENCQLARAAGVALPSTTEADTLAYMDSLPAGSTPSMQRDLHAGRHSELEEWTGAAVSIGARLKHEVPINRFIYAALLPLHQRGIGGQGEGFTPGA